MKCYIRFDNFVIDEAAVVVKIPHYKRAMKKEIASALNELAKVVT